MRRRLLCLLFVAAFMTSGCSNINRILYPEVGKGELYYNRVRSVTKNNVDNGSYNDLFLDKQIALRMTQKSVAEFEKRTKTGESLNYLDVKPQVNKDDELGKWMQNALYSYGFSGANREDNKIIYYMIKSTNQDNTYNHYLLVMRALTVKYGECTTEIYRKSDNSIMNVISKQSDKTGDDMIKQISGNFANGEVSMMSRWVMTDYDIKVDFRSPADCSIIYEFKY